MNNKESLMKKYSITEEQAELLEVYLRDNVDLDETSIILEVTNIAVLTDKLTEMGFSPNVQGCEFLVSCIPDATRSSYPENVVAAALEYIMQ